MRGDPSISTKRLQKCGSLIHTMRAQNDAKIYLDKATPSPGFGCGIYETVVPLLYTFMGGTIGAQLALIHMSHSSSQSCIDKSTSSPSSEDKRKALTTLAPVSDATSKSLRVFCIGFAVFLAILAPVVGLLIHILVLHKSHMS